MKRGDIIRMAEECGIPEFENNESQAENILRFAEKVCVGVWNAALEKAADDFDLGDDYYYDEVRDSILRLKK
jgi:hypothetical protein